jgi:4-amino-4-deoxy-L-arabinose transferase-like glycosyltransferase
LYLLGRDLFDRPTAALACLLMAVSPMFLVLSGSLMPHALTLALGLVFMLSYRRVERALPHALDWRTAGWAALAGAALGWVAITRPLTVVSLTLPFIGLALWRLRGSLSIRTLAPFVLLAAAALAVSALYPAYVWALTGDPTTNLYTLWWPYDKIGFGPGISPSNGHTLEQAVVNARADLGLWSSDLFGWSSISWIFLLPGIVARLRSAWGWTLLALFPSFVAVHLAYWVGSQVYGTRYYYEALPGLALLTAAGMRWLVGLRLSGRWRQAALATLVAVLLAVNGVLYLPGRMRALRGLNTITGAPLVRLAEIQERDVLVVAHAERWWEYGALLAQTSPWLDGPLVVARDILPSATETAITAYPDRQLLYFYRGQFYEEKPY